MPRPGVRLDRLAGVTESARNVRADFSRGERCPYGQGFIFGVAALPRGGAVEIEVEVTLVT